MRISDWSSDVCSADLPVDVTAVLDGVVRLVADQAARAEVDLRTEVAGDGLHVEGNERLLRQILVNLVSNALKFTPSGGSIVASASADARGSVTIAVRDRGAGMPSDVVEFATRQFGDRKSVG